MLRKCQNTYPLGDFGVKSIKNTYPLRDSGFKFGKNTYPLRDWDVKKHTLEGGTSRHSIYGSAPPGPLPPKSNNEPIRYLK